MGCFSLLHGDVSLQLNIRMGKLISLYFPDLRARALLIPYLDSVYAVMVSLSIRVYLQNL
uniref:Uncharacterized protein n=1 Tax=Manihot esculenta TaxID=3983 RepID=A0A2C9UN04_MANES